MTTRAAGFWVRWDPKNQCIPGPACTEETELERHSGIFPIYGRQKIRKPESCLLRGHPTARNICMHADTREQELQVNIPGTRLTLTGSSERSSALHTGSRSSACCSDVFSFITYINSLLSCLPPFIHAEVQPVHPYLSPAQAFPTNFGFLKSHERSGGFSADLYQLIKGQPAMQQPQVKRDKNTKPEREWGGRPRIKPEVINQKGHPRVISHQGDERQNKPSDP